VVTGCKAIVLRGGIRLRADVPAVAQSISVIELRRDCERCPRQEIASGNIDVKFSENRPRDNPTEALVQDHVTIFGEAHLPESLRPTPAILGG
jgi:hypothetical protein